MPDFLESKLKQTAAKKGLSGRKADAYVYGTMNNLGAMHGNKITAKGREMEEKHEAKTMAKKPTHRLRSMRIERHYDKAGKITGHTIHHELEPANRGKSKSGAFYEGHETESHPFGADDHDGMIDHVDKHLSAGLDAGAEPDGDEGEEA